jgi:hypothetical protein
MEKSMKANLDKVKRLARDLGETLVRDANRG